MDALVQYQEAFARGLIPVQPGIANRDILVARDDPNDKPRFSYMQAQHRTLMVLVMLVQIGWDEEGPIFEVGYAVAPEFRGRGLAVQTLAAALDELSAGLARAKVPMMTIEAVVGAGNLSSERVALAIFGEAPTSITDEISGEPALLFRKVIACERGTGLRR